MGITSNTGLIASVPNPLWKRCKSPVDLPPCKATPAPFILRPFAGLYNPFSHGCSILCNHPADADIKDVVKRAKDALASENKFDMLAEEMAALRASIQQAEKQAILETTVDFVPEELFRRYTQTDSRPLTPAPTLASAVSRSSLRRRCLTPDQPPVQRKKLVLDLRRSHSQETLCWHAFQTSDLGSGLGFSSVGASDATPGAGSSPTKLAVTVDDGQMPPLVSPATLSRRSPYLRGNLSDRTSRNQLRVLQAKHLTQAKSKAAAPENVLPVEEPFVDEVEVADEDNLLVDVDSADMRRRGRRRKGRHRVMSAVLVSNTNDPETQIAGIGSESHNPSSRASIAPNDEIDSHLPSATTRRQSRAVIRDSFLEPDILKHLQREVDKLTIESEFDHKRRYVFEEALRTRPEKSHGKEMNKLMKEMKMLPPSINKWLHTPRVFSRKNAIFSLPIDRRDLEGLTPIQYVADYVNVASSKQLLYQTVLEKFNPDSFVMPVECIKEALCIMMGETLTEEMAESFRKLLRWDTLSAEHIQKMANKNIMESEIPVPPEEISMEEYLNRPATSLFAEFDTVPESTEEPEVESLGIHFRLWCGICGLCERLYGPLPSLKRNFPHEVEVADFDTLQSKLATLKVDESLAYILTGIQKTHTEEIVDY